MKEKIKDKDGNLHTIAAVSRMINRCPQFVSRRVAKGFKTLESIVEESKNYNSIGARLHTTIHGRMTAMEVATQAGVKQPTVISRANTRGWMSPAIFYPDITREELNQRLRADGIYVSRMKTKPEKVFISDSLGNRFGTRKASEMTGIKQNSIYHYATANGCKTFEDLAAIKAYHVKYQRATQNKPKFVPPSMVHAQELKQQKLDRKRCKRIEKSEKCKHYPECTSASCFGVWPSVWWKSDYSCYDGKRLVVGQMSSCQPTDHKN